MARGAWLAGETLAREHAPTFTLSYLDELAKRHCLRLVKLDAAGSPSSWYDSPGDLRRQVILSTSALLRVHGFQVHQ